MLLYLGANRKSYSQDSFWFYPWGSSITHKGVDIFARKGTELYASTSGIVLYTGSLSKGGNAKGKPAHLQYAIKTWIPYIWQADNARQGWRKMFYLNPVEYLNSVTS